nr:SOS response-associated peptidase [Cutibacterium avidum]
MHDRMPVFLTEIDLGEWLDPGHLDSVQTRGLATHISETRDTIAHEPRVNQLWVTPRE